MKGTDEKNDILSDDFMVDVKLRKRWQIQQWFRDLKVAAIKEGSVPIVTVREPKKKLRLAVVELDYLVELLREAGHLGEE